MKPVAMGNALVLVSITAHAQRLLKNVYFLYKCTMEPSQQPLIALSGHQRYSGHLPWSRLHRHSELILLRTRFLIKAR